jgi:hypothetical protein
VGILIFNDLRNDLKILIFENLYLSDIRDNIVKLHDQTPIGVSLSKVLIFEK